LPAVVLDLVQPIIARRRFVGDTGELRLDPLRWLGCFPHKSTAAHSAWDSYLRSNMMKRASLSAFAPVADIAYVKQFVGDGPIPDVRLIRRHATP
jgi:hypothetical protein